MRGGSVAEIVGLSVRLRGLSLGRVVDVVLDQDARRAVGLEIHCGDDERRFLPLAGAHLSPDGVEVRSALVMLDEAELGFYRERGTTLAAVRGALVTRKGDPVGTLDDLLLGPGDVVAALVVSTADGPEGVPFGHDVAVGRPRSVGAAS